MTRRTVILNGAAGREQAAKWCMTAPDRTTVTFIKNVRTPPQNDRMWAMLTAVASQMNWHGVRLEPEDWKLIFMDSLNREMRIVPNIDGTGFVNLGTSTSKLSKSEHSDLTMIIEAFAAKHELDLGEGPDK